MAKPEGDYPVFKVEEVVASRGPEYKQIIPKINPRYFLSNPRFSSLGPVSSPRLIDYLGIYEEGDRWTLAILEASINHAAQYLFLPLTEGIPPDSRNPKFGVPAFGIETNSAFYGRRQWQVFDAFADGHFIQKLCNLFFPWSSASEKGVNAYMEIQPSGLGNFIFHTKSELAETLHLYSGEVEPVESSLVLRVGDYNLKIYQTIPAMDNIKLLQGDSNVAGWINYTGEQGLQLLIGILYKVKNKPW